VTNSTTAASAAPSVGAVGLVLAGLVCQEVGAGIAVTLFPQVGSVGMVALRLGFSAIILMVAFRPSVRGRNVGDWMTVVGFGLVLAVMNVLFYLAIARIPLGTAVTIEFLGPLVLSVVISRRASAWLWAALALAGVALLGRDGFDGLDPVGVAFALGAGAMWVGYILLSGRTGQRFAKLDGLAIAMTIGAVVTIPVGAVTAGPAIFAPHILLFGLAVAVLSSAIPYGLELLALRRLPSATFSILLSLAPALAALAGLVILRQSLGWLDVAAIAFVIAASMGAVRAAARRTTSRGTPGALR
jgi:inner membrane transporter RhtA